MLAQTITADTARGLRARLRRYRLHVSKQLDAYAGQSRGRAMAEGLSVLAVSGIEAKMSRDDVSEMFAEMGARLYDEMHNRAS